MDKVKSKIYTIVIFTLYIFISFSTYAQLDTIFAKSPDFKGKYFSNNTPEAEPLIFASGLMNPRIHHYHSPPVFSQALDEMYFSVYPNYEDTQCIFVSKKRDGIWRKPELAKFSGQYQDGRPILSPDGNTLYFYSKRPFHIGDSTPENSNIWYVKRRGDDWTSPQLLSFSESLGSSFYPDHYASDGIFYFSVKIASRDYEIYQCKIINDRPVNIKRVDEPVSMIGSIELGAVTNKENTVLVFQKTVNRNGDNGSILQASIKQNDGKWGDPKPLSDKINQGITRFASFTRDGKYFFFTSTKSGVEEIYWIKSADIFDDLK